MAAFPSNFGDLAYVPMRAFPERPAVIQGNVTLTYGELDARMKRVANLLRALDVQAGRRVALLFPNEWPFVEVCFGTMRAGAVPVPLNIRAGYETLRYCVEHSDADAAGAGRAPPSGRPRRPDAGRDRGRARGRAVL